MRTKVENEVKVSSTFFTEKISAVTLKIFKNEIFSRINKFEYANDNNYPNKSQTIKYTL